MTTTMAVGHAASGEGAAQGRSAASEAREAISGAPVLGLVFASSKLDLTGVARGIREVVGEGVPVIGCSTAGEFVTDRISSGGTALALIASDELTVSTTLATGLRANTARCVRQLVDGVTKNRRPLPGGTQQLGDGGLRPQQLGDGGLRPQRTVLLLSDGMAGNGEGLVDTLAMELGGGISLVGGAAGDDAAFKETEVLLDGRVVKDAAVVCEMTSRKKMGIGVYHGWCAASPPGTVTKAEGARVIAIDGKPAIEFYRAYAKLKGVELTPANQNQFVFTHELGIVLMNNELKVRAPLSVLEDGSIHCATEVPAGQQVTIVEGDHDAIVAAARQASETALRDLGGQKAAGCIVFDCVARKMVLGDGFRREVEAFADVTRVPVIGFNTYGEIARVRGQLSGFHNTTAVVCVLPA